MPLILLCSVTELKVYWIITDKYCLHLKIRFDLKEVSVKFFLLSMSFAVIIILYTWKHSGWRTPVSGNCVGKSEVYD